MRQQPTLDQQRPAAAPAFRSGVNLVLVDVVVRDRSGAVVKGLTADDFELLEDGKPQQIVTFAYEEIAKPTRRRSSERRLSPARRQRRRAAPSRHAPAGTASGCRDTLRRR